MQQDVEQQEDFTFFNSHLNADLGPPSFTDKNDHDIIAFLQLLSEGLEKVQSAKDEDFVLVVGNTGSGKSTTINYLLGYEMISIYDGGLSLRVKTKDDNPIAEIGHTNDSQTVYPLACKKENMPFVFCDCPGFSENRGSVYSATGSVFTEYAVKISKQIRGILVVIEVDSLVSGKGELFDKLITILTQLITNPEKLKNSICFVITKCTVSNSSEISSKEKAVMKEILNIKTRIETTFKNLNEMLKKAFQRPQDHHSNSTPTEGFDKEEDVARSLESRLTIFDLISENNIVVVDALDQGQSRERIFSKIDKMKVVQKKEFNFKTYNSDRNLFNKYIFEYALNTIQYLRLQIALSTSVEELERKTGEYRKSYSDNLLRIASLKPVSAEISPEDHLKGRIKYLRDRIKYITTLEQQKFQKITEYEKKIQKLTQKKGGIDTNEQVLYWCESIHDIRHKIFGIRACTRRIFTYSDLPFHEGQIIFTWFSRDKQVVCKKKYAIKDLGQKVGKGRFYEIDSRPDTGYFSAKYRSKAGENGIASITILLPKRNMPDNFALIKEINNEIDRLNSKKLTLEGELASLKQTSHELSNEIEELEKKGIEDAATIEEKIKEYLTENRVYLDEIAVAMNKIAEFTKELDEVNTWINSNEQQFVLFVKLASVINYETSDLIHECIQQLKSRNKQFDFTMSETIFRDNYPDFIAHQCSDNSAQGPPSENGDNTLNSSPHYNRQTRNFSREPMDMLQRVIQDSQMTLRPPDLSPRSRLNLELEIKAIEDQIKVLKIKLIEKKEVLKRSGSRHRLFEKPTDNSNNSTTSDSPEMSMLSSESHEEECKKSDVRQMLPSDILDSEDECNSNEYTNL